MSEPENLLNFTVKEILVEFRREVRDEFSDLRESIDIKDHDKETRLRALERFRYAVPSAALVAVTVSAVGFFLHS